MSRNICTTAGCGRPVHARGICNKHYDQARENGPLPACTTTAGMSLEQRFHEGYIPEPNSGCWLWFKGLNNDGYGKLMEKGRTFAAHRYAWELRNGEIPDGVVVRHKCDTPICVNPRHLQIGTHRDNQADKVAKNRQAKGSQTNASKLTEQQVIEIRLRHRAAKLTYQSTAIIYGVCRHSIRNVVDRKTWDHVNG